MELRNFVSFPLKTFCVRKKTTDEDGEVSFTAGGIATWDRHFRRQFGCFLQK